MLLKIEGVNTVRGERMRVDDLPVIKVDRNGLNELAALEVTSMF
jgi:hypothetical protein